MSADVLIHQREENTTYTMTGVVEENADTVYNDLHKTLQLENPSTVSESLVEQSNPKDAIGGRTL